MARKWFRVFILFSSLALMVLVEQGVAVASQGGEAGFSPGLKQVEYNLSIQVNVLRLCANGRVYDFIEADSDGNGPTIKPYVVEAVSPLGEPLSCAEGSGGK